MRWATSDAVERVLSGETWGEFCDALKAAGAVVLREASPRDPLDRAEGFRYLTRLLRTALEQQLEFADPLAPAFRRPSHETVKIGADNPDNHYQSASISGSNEYRIRGVRNSVHYLGIGTYAGGYGSSGRSGPDRLHRRRDARGRRRTAASRSRSRANDVRATGCPWSPTRAR